MPANTFQQRIADEHRVIIIGGGFGGLYAAQNLGSQKNIEVLLIDRRNFHLFQPLLYQVATGGLSPGDIASPLRAVLKRYQNIRVLQAEVRNIDPGQQAVYIDDDCLYYDSLIIATGAHHHYFGNPQWETNAPGLKTIEDALEMRRRIFRAFEAAEKEQDPVKQSHLMTFVIVGAGPTGVELAGALGELAHSTLKHDFRHLDPEQAKIILIEGGNRILPTYEESLSKKAQRSLERLGVTVQTNTFVTNIDDDIVTVKTADHTETIPTKTILWAAGVQSSSLSSVLTEQTGVESDSIGRVLVAPDLSIPDYPDIFVIGDLANFSHQTGKPLPGIAPVAMQQGRYVARLLKKRLRNKPTESFKYFDKGNLAVIGRNAAIADIGGFRLSGWFAWIIWVFVHIMYLVEFDNRVLVLFQWASNYLTRKRGARLITNEKSSKTEKVAVDEFS